MVFSRQEAVSGYLRTFIDLLEEVDLASLERVLAHLRSARDRGSTIFLAGNGGSAATAAHWANDLNKATKRDGVSPMRVLNLTDNVSWLTALANDEGYERVFSGQLENFARREDVLIVISASGNSPNLINAVELARSLGMVTIGFLGFDGGALKEKVDEFLWVRTEVGAYGLVETAHSLLCDLIVFFITTDSSAPVRSRETARPSV